MFKKRILGLIMSTGSCFVLSGFLINMICVMQSPINTGLCIEYTSDIHKLLSQSGFQIQSGFSMISGVVVYFLATKGRMN